MEDQVTMQPTKTKKAVSLTLFIIVVTLLSLALAGLIWLNYTTNNKLLDEVSTISDSIKTPEKSSSTEADEEETNAPTEDTYEATILSAVKSVCAANLSTCTNITIVKKSGGYAEVSLSSQYQNASDQLPVRSMLVKNNGDEWVMVFVKRG